MSFAGGNPNRPACPSPDQLLRYRRGGYNRVESAEARQLAEHVADCPLCQADLDSVRALGPVMMLLENDSSELSNFRPGVEDAQMCRTLNDERLSGDLSADPPLAAHLSACLYCRWRRDLALARAAPQNMLLRDHLVEGAIAPALTEAHRAVEAAVLWQAAETALPQYGRHARRAIQPLHVWLDKGAQLCTAGLDLFTRAMSPAVAAALGSALHEATSEERGWDIPLPDAGGTLCVRLRPADRAGRWDFRLSVESAVPGEEVLTKVDICDDRGNLFFGGLPSETAKRSLQLTTGAWTLLLHCGDTLLQVAIVLGQGPENSE